MITLLKPVCIHCENQIRKKRIYENDYEKYIDKGYWENSFWDNDEGREVDFVDAPIDTVKKYYLFYKTKNHSFHIPIDNIDGLGLDVIEIDNIVTYGEDISELISTQFCNKLIDLVKSNNYLFLTNLEAM